MEKLKRYFTSELVISTLLFGILLCFTTLTYDDYGSFLNNIAAMQFSSFPALYLHYLSFIGVGEIYNGLFKLFPNYNLMGIIFVAFQFWCLYILLNTIKKDVLATHQSRLVRLTIQLLFALFFIENILNISHTRFSLLLCGLSLFILAFRKEVNNKQTAWYTFVFLLGMLNRPESSIGLILLVSAGYLIYRFNLLHLIKRLFFPGLLTVVLFGAIAYDWAHTDIFVRKVEPEIEYKVMDKRVVPLSDMHTAVDSAKYMMVVTGTWIDPTIISPEYMRTLLVSGVNTSPKHVMKVFNHLSEYYYHYIFAVAYVAFLFLLALFSKTPKVVLLKMILFLLASGFVVFISDYNGLLISYRHLANLHIVSMLIFSYYFFGNYQPANGGVAKTLATAVGALIVLYSLGITLQHYFYYNKIQVDENICCEKTMQEIENRYQNRIIVTTASDVYLLNHNFSFRTNIYKRNKYIMYDMFTYTFIPKYVEYLESECNCDAYNPAEVMKWLSSQKALYFADEFRYNLTQNYLKEVRNTNVRFIPERPINHLPCLSSTSFTEFELREVHVDN